MTKWKGFWIIATGVLAIAPVLPSQAEDEVERDISRCSSIDDHSERLACYDDLARREQSPLDVDDAPAPAAPAAAPLPREPGPEVASQGRAPEEGKDEAVAARVVRCTQDAFKKYNFYLDGGQIWKQVSDKKLRFKACDFNVTISKDYFGYKMQIEGETGRFRVKRVR